MAYNGSIPQSSDLISSSQAQILANFTAIDSASTGFAVDHVTLTDNTNGGKHKQITFLAPLTPVAPAGSIGLEYTKTVSARSELHYRNATAEVPITSSNLVAASGEGFMPGGLQIRCGSATNIPSGGVTITFSTAFPTACIGVVLTPFAAQSTLTVTAKSASNFTVSRDGAGLTSAYYVAVGY